MYGHKKREKEAPKVIKIKPKGVGLANHFAAGGAISESGSDGDYKINRNVETQGPASGTLNVPDPNTDRELKKDDRPPIKPYAAGGAVGDVVASAPDPDGAMSDDAIIKAAGEDGSVEEAIRAIIEENKAKGGKAAEAAHALEKKFLAPKNPTPMAAGGEVKPVELAQAIDDTDEPDKGGESITIIKKGDTDGIHSLLKKMISEHEAMGGEKAKVAHAMHHAFSKSLEGFADGGEVLPQGGQPTPPPAPEGGAPEAPPAGMPPAGSPAPGAAPTGAATPDAEASSQPPQSKAGMFSEYAVKGIPSSIVDAANSAIEALKNEGPGAASGQLQTVMTDLMAAAKGATGEAKSAFMQMKNDLTDVINGIKAAGQDKSIPQEMKA